MFFMKEALIGWIACQRHRRRLPCEGIDGIVGCRTWRIRHRVTSRNDRVMKMVHFGRVAFYTSAGDSDVLQSLEYCVSVRSFVHKIKRLVGHYVVTACPISVGKAAEVFSAKIICRSVKLVLKKLQGSVYVDQPASQQ